MDGTSLWITHRGLAPTAIRARPAHADGQDTNIIFCWSIELVAWKLCGNGAQPVDGFPDSPGLSASEREQLAAILEYFAEACLRVDGAVGQLRLDDFLPPPGSPLRLATLWRLIPADLQRRWMSGDHAQLEDYVEQYPELGGVAQLPTQLLWEEYALRLQWESTPKPEDYQQRFPGQFAEFCRLVARSSAPPDRHQASAQETSPEASDATPPAATLQFVTAQVSGPGPDDTLEPATTRVPEATQAETFRTVGGGRYKLIRPLGRGQYGEVWLSEAQGGVLVAIKIIRFPIRHQMSQQELRSLELMKQLRYPFLLEVHSYWTEDDQLMIVTTLADKTLADRLRECRLAGSQGIPQKELLSYILDAAEAIDFLHERKIIHRDIKPANILLVEGRSKVGDFGLARVLERAGDASLMRATTIGTPLYMAPEVFDGKASPRCDQYSLATTYVELRRGRAPFQAETAAEIMKAILTKPPDLMHLDKAEQQVLEKALAKNPSDRYASCKEFTAELEKAIFPPPPPPSKWRMRALLASVILLSGLLGWFSWPRSRKPEVPVGFLPATNAAVVFCSPSNRYFYDRLVKQLPQGMEVEFLLISSDNPPTFYMMKHKVWNALFAQFAEQCPQDLAENSRWALGASVKDRDGLTAAACPEIPVFQVTYDEAARFAAWLGGRLPSAQEWDKAAGLQEHPADRTGPFLPNQPLESIGLSPHGPVPITRSETADVSPLGVCDMAGNGMEWTRDQIPLRGDPEESFLLRGMDYRKSKPLDYQFPYWDSRSQPRSASSPSIGFRVVIDPLSSEQVDTATPPAN